MEPTDITQPNPELDVDEGRRRRRNEDPQVEGHLASDPGAEETDDESRRRRRHNETPDVEGHRR